MQMLKVHAGALTQQHTRYLVDRFLRVIREVRIALCGHLDSNHISPSQRMMNSSGQLPVRCSRASLTLPGTMFSSSHPTLTAKMSVMFDSGLHIVLVSAHTGKLALAPALWA